ncbi:hypothetical protein APHAL10511_007846 [Amanita phalloides]|nr:hypothetical protein APHAL10511_007846 [Amanita phalloides]
MVKYTVAASVALVQMAMFARTSVALPIEYPEELESRAISNPNGQQLAERELEARLVGTLALVGGAVLTAEEIKKHEQKQDEKKDDQQGKRDLSDLDARDWKEFVKRYVNDELDKRMDAQSVIQQLHSAWKSSSSSAPHTDQQQNRRDLSDLYERDWDEYEKRSFNDIEERDWNEFQERDWDDYELEARGLDFDELDELD